MIKIDKTTKDQLLQLYKTKKISLEGNILKVIDPNGDGEFEKYLNESIEKDKEVRRKRLEITKQVQSQNTDLIKWKTENERVTQELHDALSKAEESNKELQLAKKQVESALDSAHTARLEAEKAKTEAENAKKTAENDLELLQKKTQFELIGSIIKVALWVIIGVGIITTGVYLIAIFTKSDTAVISSTWTNIIGILLTNSFSIVGTIMGVKYASESKS